MHIYIYIWHPVGYVTGRRALNVHVQQGGLSQHRGKKGSPAIRRAEEIGSVYSTNTNVFSSSIAESNGHMCRGSNPVTSRLGTMRRAPLAQTKLPCRGWDVKSQRCILTQPLR